jgi:pimeloyl-ACP methyl ester carboxylesterase/DNA-binding CsgD family transcriptional regulator
MGPTTGLRQRVRFCTSAGDGVRIAFAQRGNGPPIVKSGNSLSHLDFEKDSTVWRHYAADLTSHYTYINYDPRGCGLSDRDVGDMSFEASLRDLEAVVDAAKLERFSLLALCGGSAVALAYAAKHPDRVSRLVIHGGYAMGPMRRSTAPHVREVYESIAKLVEFGWELVSPAYRQMIALQFLPDATPEHYRAFHEFARASVSSSSFASRFRTLYDLDVGEFARQVTCPTLVTHSMNDPWVPMEEGRFLASLIPQAQFVPIRSQNHLLLAHEASWQQWIDEIRSFIPRETSDSPIFGDLTRRERELVDLMARGLSNTEIAAELELSQKTVKNYVTSVFAKLEVDSRAQLIVRAREAGFGSLQALAS